MSDWTPISDYNGREKYASSVLLRLASGVELEGFWHNQLLDDKGRECGGWAAVGDDYPPSWTEGICWEINEDCVASDQPTHWCPVPSPTSTGAA